MRWLEEQGPGALTAPGERGVADVPEASGTLYGKLSPGRGMRPSEVAAHQRARIHSAIAEIVAKDGYGAVKVREIVALAGVSTRAFYEHFDSKEDCFLRTHELIVRRAARGIMGAQGDEVDWRDRLRRIFRAFTHELESEPYATQLALVDAYVAGPAALEQARRAEFTFATMVGESLARDPDGIVVPPLVVEGLVAGVERVSRNRLLAGREAELPGLEDELMAWALSYLDESATALSKLDRRAATVEARTDTGQAPSTATSDATKPSGDDREFILSAVIKLAGADGYRNLTVPRIRRAAGVSRAAFNSHFEGVEDCFLAAVQRRVDNALEAATRAQTAGRDWRGGLYRAIAALCDLVVDDLILVNLCLADEFAPKSDGSHWRQNLIADVAEQLRRHVPPEWRSGAISAEASTAAVWAVFHHHVVRAPTHHRPQVAATLSYLALAPTAGAAGVVGAIEAEQKAMCRR